MWCAMSEYDDNTNKQEDYVHIHLSSVAFHVLSVGLGFHVVTGVGRLVVRFHHAHVIPSFILDVAVRLYLVIVNPDCSQNYCMLHIAKTGPLRCCPCNFLDLFITFIFLPRERHGKRASRLPERWSDGLFLGVVERSSEFYVGTVLGVVRARSLRRRPLEEGANVELLDKLVGVPWQLVPKDLDATAVPTVISAEPIAEGDDLPDRADPIYGAARRTHLRKNIELRRHGYTGGCPGCDAARLNTAAKPHGCMPRPC